jgi:endonuclease/exonuclease/phosphatase family metal-dependent hydrolase
MFTALTLNLQNGQIWDPANPDSAPIDLSRALAFLAKLEPDVIFLQEVEQGRDGGGRKDCPTHFNFLRAHLAGYDSTLYLPPDHPDELPFGLGIAIFSKSPLRAIERIELPAAPICFEFGGRLRKPVPRTLLAATADLDGIPVRLFNTHLQAYFMIGTNSEEHPEQRNALVTELMRARGAVLLGGDFNVAPGERLVEQLAACGFQTAQNTIPTWKRRPFIVDHLFFNNRLRLDGCEVLQTDASDHHAVLGRFEHRQPAVTS